MPSVNWKQAIGEQTGEYRELNYPSSVTGSAASPVVATSASSSSSSSGGSLIESHTNGTLTIARVGQEHAGHFLCQASNGIGADLSKLIRLTVHGKKFMKVISKLDDWILKLVHLFFSRSHGAST